LFTDKEVLRVVDVLVRTSLNAVDDSWLEIYENGPGDVAGVVRLVEEDIFTVSSFGRKILEITVTTDTVLLAKLLPEFCTSLATRASQISRLRTDRNPGCSHIARLGL